MTIFAIKFKYTVMKHRNNVIIILLNILFSAVLLYFFVNNSYLRPWAGSVAKEMIIGLLLLATIYANYFLIYPLLHKKHPVVYWMVVVLVSIVAGLIEMAIAWPFMKYCNAAVIEQWGSFRMFTHHGRVVAARDLAFNFFPFMFRERQQLQQALKAEVKAVYQQNQMLDVIDKDNNVLLVPKDDIYYCMQDGNFTRIYMVQGNWFTRYGSMKHLVQLFGEEEFIRVSPTLLIPVKYIWSCNGNEVVLKKMPWTEKPQSFSLDPKNSDQISDRIAEGCQQRKTETIGDQPQRKQIRSKSRRKPAVPPQQKIDDVLTCIQAHPGCNTTEIIAQTAFSLSTVERCLSELRKRQLVKYVGSKRNGGYHAVTDVSNQS